MARQDSVDFAAGFSVYQPAVGAPVEFVPAMGTKELSDLIAAYLPGAGSFRDKVTALTLDFFEHARVTGECYKFYPVVTSPFFSPVTMDSPASSAGLVDSGYGSSFDVSPIPSHMSPWTPSFPEFSAPLAAAAPVGAGAGQLRPAVPHRAAAATGDASSSSRSQTADLSQLPGMRIMTRDGRDVTTSASRGCKTKEQRDHAHLMRIIKACDACRRKKIRCDPSHKKRVASSTSGSSNSANVRSRADSTSTHRTNKSKSPGNGKQQQATAQDVFGLVFAASPLYPTTSPPPSSSQGFSPDFFDDLTDAFVDLSQDPAAPSMDLDFFLDPTGLVEAAESSSPSDRGLQSPFNATAPPGFDDSPPTRQEPSLPYLQSGHIGTNYVDFNLYSPASSVLDEEPQDLPMMRLAPSLRQRASQTTDFASLAPFGPNFDVADDLSAFTDSCRPAGRGMPQSPASDQSGQMIQVPGWINSGDGATNERWRLPLFDSDSPGPDNRQPSTGLEANEGPLRWGHQSLEGLRPPFLDDDMIHGDQTNCRAPSSTPSRTSNHLGVYEGSGPGSRCNGSGQSTVPRGLNSRMVDVDLNRHIARTSTDAGLVSKGVTRSQVLAACTTAASPSLSDWSLIPCSGTSRPAPTSISGTAAGLGTQNAPALHLRMTKSVYTASGSLASAAMAPPRPDPTSQTALPGSRAEARVADAGQLVKPPSHPMGAFTATAAGKPCSITSVLLATLVVWNLGQALHHSLISSTTGYGAAGLSPAWLLWCRLAILGLAVVFYGLPTTKAPASVTEASPSEVGFGLSMTAALLLAVWRCCSWVCRSDRPMENGTVRTTVFAVSGSDSTANTGARAWWEVVHGTVTRARCSIARRTGLSTGPKDVWKARRVA